MSGECAECAQKKGLLQRKANTYVDTTEVPPIVHEVLCSRGQPLDSATCAFMESRFGHDFSHVRVHTDAKAAESAHAVNALAYTVGGDIVLAAGQYAPGSVEGRHLLAHELTHVVQQGLAAHAEAMAIAADTSPTELEAERVSQDVTSGDRVEPVRETVRAGQISCLPQPASTPPRAPQQQRVRLDILGADMSVKDALVRSAAQALGTDIRVTSLADMIAKLEAQAGPSTGRCVENLAIWNHGSPGGQMVVGSETIRTRDDRIIRFPYSGLTLDWLLREGNQAALGRLRDVFCCDATMQWLGCGTAGVEAAGGARTEAERAESRLRYAQYGDRYRDAQDAAAHGASLMGATFGNLNVQSWADATCTTINASTDFTYFSPSNPGQLFRAGHGGQFVAFPPRQAGHCVCNPETGRPQSAWNITEAKRFIREREKSATGGDYLWHLYLNTFQALWKMRAHLEIKDQVVAAVQRLIVEAAAGTTMPAALPVSDVRPWINIDTANPDWAAVTSPHLVFCFPDNCWRWIAVNHKAIQTTPSYTQEVLAHELIHAEDMWTAAQEYIRKHGNPPAGAGDRCKPVGEGVRRGWTDAWGQYINGFFDFYQGRLTTLRHEEIYAESVTPHWPRITVQEKLTWFGGVLQNIPPNLPTNQTFQAEQMVSHLFQNPRPEELTLRQEMGLLLGRTTAEFVLGDSKGQGIDLGKGRSLLRHFQPVWLLQPRQRAILLQAVPVG